MKQLFLIMMLLFSNSALSVSVEDNLKASHAFIGVCLLYAESLGADVEPFSELSANIFKAAEMLGYTEDAATYFSHIAQVRKAIIKDVAENYQGKEDFYNNKCVPVYNKFVDKIENLKSEMGL